MIMIIIILIIIIIIIKVMKALKLRLNESYNFTSGKCGQGTCEERHAEIHGNIKTKMRKNTLLTAYQIIMKDFYLIQGLGPRKGLNYYAVLSHDIQGNLISIIIFFFFFYTYKIQTNNHYPKCHYKEPYLQFSRIKKNR